MQKIFLNERSKFQFCSIIVKALVTKNCRSDLLQICNICIATWNGNFISFGYLCKGNKPLLFFPYPSLTQITETLLLGKKCAAEGTFSRVLWRVSAASDYRAAHVEPSETCSSFLWG